MFFSSKPTNSCHFSQKHAKSTLDSANNSVSSQYSRLPSEFLTKLG